jgi:hypothetical protein
MYLAAYCGVRYKHKLGHTLKVFLSFIFVGALLITTFFFHIPFIEGSKIVSEGEAYHFKIGMSKEEAFATLIQNYQHKGYELNTLYPDETKSFIHVSYNIENLKDINSNLLNGVRWDINIPANWVHSIGLVFIGNKLVQIQKDRYLFERL